MNRRVVITGCGLISPIGVNTIDYWNNLISGKSGIGPITRFDTEDFSVKIAGEVRGFDPLAYISKKNVRRMDYFTQYAVAAALQAIDQAKLEISKQLSPRVGVFVSSCNGGFNYIQENVKNLLENGPKRVSPYFSSATLVNIPSGEISILIGAKGQSGAIVTACATGTSSVGEAMRLIQSGRADVMLAGGTADAITPLDLAAYSNVKALSRRNEEPEKASRPFDRDRDGFVIGAGGGVLVLEEAEHAIGRGAKILAELVGYGATTDAYHITAPDPSGSGAVRAIRLALEEAKIQPRDVNYINAHGTSTPFNDQMETKAIKTVFGEDAGRILVSSNKSMIGHLMGGAGAVELIATVYSILEKKVPPTINCDHPDDELDLNYVPHQAQSCDIEYAISNSFGFGGHNAVLVVRRWNESSSNLL
ncbi:beta-ketoacyl-ACP synthase II [Desmospora activa]|uniref:3-oxoacyl-[acyl-carrier-protein] synthase 2 n=1 Tax=Desmospora activa DSM 45169 TaxID=1121389 RepID=A0A2T4ZAC3_9BACL|nr:3-oxoacyl-[acyl-carrier-protein] synthase II [Desmospora activa DSM 45169]